MKFNLACLLLISSLPALLIDDLNSLNTCGEKKPKDFPDRAFLPTGFNSYSVKLKFSDITCSGSVIDKNAILTAAHCCLDLSKMPTIYFAEFWNKGDPYYDR
ncbi:unnamed protein product [Oikopleura dioica]|uniref:Peptidase S1 domain-containing protein n=1 Tax=Oikopleura dioica TaxID=34765 RepID=E4X3L4_OIKDI|nr:unnamed protein product [Oikopleura dioica]